MDFKKWRHVAGSVLGLTLLVLACWALRRQLQDYRTILDRLGRYSDHHGAILVALAMTLAAYLVLTGYDLLAMRWIGHRLTVGKVAFTSFLSYVFSNNIGMSVVGASAIRLRLYTAWGLSIMEIVKIVAFVSFTFWLGLLNIGAVNFVIHPMELPAGWHLSWLGTSRPVGVILLGVIVGYIAICWRVRKPIRIGSKALPIPSAGIAVAQVAVGSLDWALAGGIFYVALNALSPGVSAPVVMVSYFLAIILGQLSHTPGGLGVFEFSMVNLLRPVEVGEAEILAAAVAYRVIYLILPLLVGAVCLGGYELLGRRRA